MPLAQCSKFYLNSIINDLAPFRDGLGEGQYCAYDPEGRKDSCQGDSGGPMQMFPDGDPSNTATVVGIISFGIGCGKLPAIYTRVAFYLNWIESIIWPHQ